MPKLLPFQGRFGKKASPERGGKEGILHHRAADFADGYVAVDHGAQVAADGGGVGGFDLKFHLDVFFLRLELSSTYRPISTAMLPQRIRYMAGCSTLFPKK